MELWDLYRRDRSLAGADHVRGQPLPEGLYHLVVHVWIKNSLGQYVISQRSADRPTYPLRWECVGGSALKGEDSRAAALRETFEEVGISLRPDRGRLVLSQIRERHRDILDVWLFDYDGAIPLDQATTKEAAQACWMPPQKIQVLMQQGLLVPTLSYFFSRILPEQSPRGS